MIQLFNSYQSLQQRLPYTSLCELPTPVHKLERLGKELGLTELYIKRDDLSGAQYGGISHVSWSSFWVRLCVQELVRL